MELSKKLGYIKGLMAGLKVDDSTNEGKVFLAITDLLEEMTEEVEMLGNVMGNVIDEIEKVKEEIIDEEFDDEDFDDDDDDFVYIDEDDDDDDDDVLDDIEAAMDNEVDFGGITLRPGFNKKPPRS